ncbi:hypothetical protein PR202_ga09532 [Eleusine coracana subsp. coracana]|uniref:At4g15545-like C-terminal domain-containing protein n=1 Tax=Eleusine coracana subsp. coracana TaxID=191504 RepID=A0AAV5C488_ELECO|nr:hypothetical protein PR202_ga09532 [Eleusine coracana subsp. coracana]
MQQRLSPKRWTRGCGTPFHRRRNLLCTVARTPRRPGHQCLRELKRGRTPVRAARTLTQASEPPAQHPRLATVHGAAMIINPGSQLLRIPPHLHQHRPLRPSSASAPPPMTQTPTPAAPTSSAPPPKPAVEPEPGLPDAIAAALPPDPYEQLEVARKITAVAVAARASRLELEAARLRQRLAERDRLAAELADRAAKLEQALRDADSRLRAALDDNLETFKRHLMQSLGDDNNPVQETVDIRTCEQSVAKANSWKAENRCHFSQKILHCRVAKTNVRCHIAATGKTSGDVAMAALQQDVLCSQLTASRALHLRWTHFKSRRSRLSYEQFAAFLANIKELNSHRQSREVGSWDQASLFSFQMIHLESKIADVTPQETLRKADEIFGAENKDLFMSFQGLLTRSLS